MSPSNACRICLGHDSLTNIFHKRGLSMLSTQIMSLARVHITPNDGLPNSICIKCIQRLDDCIKFIQLCENSDVELRLTLENNRKRKIKTEDLWLDDDSVFRDDEGSSSSRSENEKCLVIDENKCQYTSEPDNIQKESEDKKDKKHKQQCFTCGKVMSSRFRLKTHLITHTGEKPFSCPHCNKCFSLSQNLKVHMRTHTGEKPLRCSVCGESFAQSAGLAAHRRKHTGQMPYRCVLCPRSFRTVGHLQYHVRRHTGEKNFECDTCGRAFITRSDLKQHMLTHTGDRPHVCSICGMRLTRSSHLKRHIQQIHNNSQKTNTNCNVK